MAQRLTPERHAQIISLLQTGSSISQAARKCETSREAVRNLKRKLEAGELDPVRPILSRLQVADNIRTLAESTDSKPSDKLNAWKLYAIMNGLLSENEGKSAQVQVNVLGSASVEVLENEYKALSAGFKSPTAHELAQGDTSPSPTRSDALLGQPSGAEATCVGANEFEGGGNPPGTDGNGV